VSPPRERPGAEARRLLGGDERVHVFPSESAALAYLTRIPGSHVHYPRRAGWARLLTEVLEGKHRVADQTCVIELPEGAPDAERVTVRAIGRELLRRGALEVTCWGRRIEGSR
jgi:hypothetical protein